MEKYKPKTKRVFSNYRVIVEVDEPWTSEKDPDKLHEHWQGRLNSVVADIKRHVDGCAQVYPDWDLEDVCIHCKSTPEPDPETGEPVCCGKAGEDYEKAGGTP